MDPFANACSVMSANVFEDNMAPEEHYCDSDYQTRIIESTLGMQMPDETLNSVWMMVLRKIQTQKFIHDYHIHEKAGLIILLKGFPMLSMRNKLTLRNPSLFKLVQVIDLDAYRFNLELLSQMHDLENNVYERQNRLYYEFMSTQDSIMYGSMFLVAIMALFLVAVYFGFF